MKREIRPAPAPEAATAARFLDREAVFAGGRWVRYFRVGRRPTLVADCFNPEDAFIGERTGEVIGGPWTGRPERCRNLIWRYLVTRSPAARRHV